MKRIFTSFVAGALLAIGAVTVALPAGMDDPVVGTWQLNLAKSKFNPGPAPKSETRVYAATADGGIEITVNGIAADGSTISQHVTYKYDGKDYAFTGSTYFDSLSVKKVDSHKAESVLKKAGKEVGHTTRMVSSDGKTMTLTSMGTNAKGAKFDNVVVYDRK